MSLVSSGRHAWVLRVSFLVCPWWLKDPYLPLNLCVHSPENMVTASMQICLLCTKHVVTSCTPELQNLNEPYGHWLSFLAVLETLQRGSHQVHSSRD